MNSNLYIEDINKILERIRLKNSENKHIIEEVKHIASNENSGNYELAKFKSMFASYNYKKSLRKPESVVQREKDSINVCSSLDEAFSKNDLSFEQWSKLKHSSKIKLIKKYVKLHFKNLEKSQQKNKEEQYVKNLENGDYDVPRKLIYNHSSKQIIRFL